MNRESIIRKKIREYVAKTLDEISTTASIDGYLTPYAFSGDGNSNEKRVKRMAKMIGYSLTKQGKEDSKNIDLKESYHKFKNDDSTTPQEKIAKSIKSVRDEIEIIERLISRCVRYQKESNMSGDDLWKVTKKQLIKLESRLQKLIEKLRTMRG